MLEQKTIRNKISNYFYYYKWHTIFALLAVFLIVTTIFQVRSRIDYDTTVVFLGNFMPEEASMKEFQDHMEQELADANGDGEVHVLPYFMMITGDVMQVQQDNATVVRLQGMLLTRETSVMIMNEAAMNALEQGEGLEDLRPLYEEYQLEITGSTYGIPIKPDNPVFSMFQMNGNQYYITQLIEGNNMNQKQTIDFQNATRLIRMVIEAQQ